MLLRADARELEHDCAHMNQGNGVVTTRPLKMDYAGYVKTSVLEQRQLGGVCKNAFMSLHT